MNKMKKCLLICVIIFFSCSSKKEESKNINNLNVRDSLLFNEEKKIVGISHFKNEQKNGLSITFNRETYTPKYLVEYNSGKRDGLIIDFYNEGKIKSLRTADLFGDSQKMEFHENGVIKSVGNTVKGRANGLWRYFNNEGELIKEVVYENGQQVN